MLKFLTHKLRTHSINEENYNQKGDEDHDSGTESDEEIDPLDLPSPGTSEIYDSKWFAFQAMSFLWNRDAPRKRRLNTKEKTQKQDKNKRPPSHINRPPTRPAPQSQGPAPTASIFGSLRKLKGGASTSTSKKVEKDHNKNKIVKEKEDNFEVANTAAGKSVADTVDVHVTADELSGDHVTNNKAVNTQYSVRRRGKENVEQYWSSAVTKGRPKSKSVVNFDRGQEELKKDKIKSSTVSLNLLRGQARSTQSEQSKPKRPITVAVPSNVSVRRGHKEGQGHQDNISRTSSVTNLDSLEANTQGQPGKGAKPRKVASKERIDKQVQDGKKAVTKNNNKLEPPLPPTGQSLSYSSDSLHEAELQQLKKQLREMSDEKSSLALQLGEQRGQLTVLQKEVQKLKEESNLEMDRLAEENTALRNRLRDVAHSPLSDNEKQQLLFESRHHNSAPASIATNVVDDNGGDATTCTTPDWDKHSSSNVSEVSVACLQDKINQMQETHYSTNEELQATLQELTDLQRQLTELQQENERLNEEKTLMFDSLCRQTERLNDSRQEVENLKQLLYRDRSDESGANQLESVVEREQKLVELLRSAQEEREQLLLKLEQIQAELQDSRAEITEKSEVSAQQTERVRTLECTLDAKHAEHKQLDQELAQAKDQCSGKQIEINRLSDLLENARTKINELEQDRTLSDKSELDELLDNARKEKDQLESEVAYLKEQLARSKNEIEKLKEQVFVLQEECKVTRNNAKTTQSDLEYKCEKLVAEKSTLGDQLQQFQEAVNELQVQAQCHLEDKRQLSAVLSETQRNLSEAERRNLSLETEIQELKKLRAEENDEWEKFQNDLLTSVRVANDFKTEAQQELQKIILENKTYREKLRLLEGQVEKLKGEKTSISTQTDVILTPQLISLAKNLDQSIPNRISLIEHPVSPTSPSPESPTSPTRSMEKLFPILSKERRSRSKDNLSDDLQKSETSIRGIRSIGNPSSVDGSKKPIAKSKKVDLSKENVPDDTAKKENKGFLKRTKSKDNLEDASQPVEKPTKENKSFLKRSKSKDNLADANTSVPKKDEPSKGSINFLKRNKSKDNLKQLEVDNSTLKREEDSGRKEIGILDKPRKSKESIDSSSSSSKSDFSKPEFFSKFIKKREKKPSSHRKTMSVEEETLLKSLDNWYLNIDQNIPDELLTKEDQAVKKLKILFEDDQMKEKPVAHKPKDQLAISKPLLNSVVQNPKLEEIVRNPRVQTVETQIRDSALEDNLSVVNDQQEDHTTNDGPRLRMRGQEIYTNIGPKSLGIHKYHSLDDLNVFEEYRTVSELAPALYRATETDNLTREEHLEIKHVPRFDRLSSEIYPNDSVSNPRYSTKFHDVHLKEYVSNDLPKPNVYINYENLDEIVHKIPRDVPENKLTEEQRFALKLKLALDEAEENSTRKKIKKKKKSVRGLEISEPTPESVQKNWKLKEIMLNPGIKNAEEAKKDKFFSDLFDETDRKRHSTDISSDIGELEVERRPGVVGRNSVSKSYEDISFSFVPENTLLSLYYGKKDEQNARQKVASDTSSSSRSFTSAEFNLDTGKITQTWDIPTEVNVKPELAVHKDEASKSNEDLLYNETINKEKNKKRARPKQITDGTEYQKSLEELKHDLSPVKTNVSSKDKDVQNKDERNSWLKGSLERYKKDLNDMLKRIDSDQLRESLRRRGFKVSEFETRYQIAQTETIFSEYEVKLGSPPEVYHEEQHHAEEAKENDEPMQLVECFGEQSGTDYTEHINSTDVDGQTSESKTADEAINSTFVNNATNDFILNERLFSSDYNVGEKISKLLDVMEPPNKRNTEVATSGESSEIGDTLSTGSPRFSYDDDDDDGKSQSAEKRHSNNITLSFYDVRFRSPLEINTSFETSNVSVVNNDQSSPIIDESATIGNVIVSPDDVPIQSVDIHINEVERSKDIKNFSNQPDLPVFEDETQTTTEPKEQIIFQFPTGLIDAESLVPEVGDDNHWSTSRDENNRFGVEGLNLTQTDVLKNQILTKEQENHIDKRYQIIIENVTYRLPSTSYEAAELKHSIEIKDDSDDLYHETLLKKPLADPIISHVGPSEPSILLPKEENFYSSHLVDIVSPTPQTAQINEEYSYQEILRENQYGVVSPLDLRYNYRGVVKEYKQKFPPEPVQEIDEVNDEGSDASDLEYNEDFIDEFFKPPKSFEHGFSPEIENVSYQVVDEVKSLENNAGVSEEIEIRKREEAVSQIDKEMQNIMEKYLHTRTSLLVRRSGVDLENEEENLEIRPNLKKYENFENLNEIVDREPEASNETTKRLNEIKTTFDFENKDVNSVEPEQVDYSEHPEENEALSLEDLEFIEEMKSKYASTDTVSTISEKSTAPLNITEEEIEYKYQHLTDEELALLRSAKRDRFSRPLSDINEIDLLLVEEISKRYFRDSSSPPSSRSSLQQEIVQEVAKGERKEYKDDSVINVPAKFNINTKKEITPPLPLSLPPKSSTEFTPYSELGYKDDYNSFDASKIDSSKIVSLEKNVTKEEKAKSSISEDMTKNVEKPFVSMANKSKENEISYLPPSLRPRKPTNQPHGIVTFRDQSRMSSSQISPSNLQSRLSSNRLSDLIFKETIFVPVTEDERIRTDPKSPSSPGYKHMEDKKSEPWRNHEKPDFKQTIVVPAPRKMGFSNELKSPSKLPVDNSFRETLLIPGKVDKSESVITTGSSRTPTSNKSGDLSFKETIIIPAKQRPSPHFSEIQKVSKDSPKSPQSEHKITIVNTPGYHSYKETIIIPNSQESQTKDQNPEILNPHRSSTQSKNGSRSEVKVNFNRYSAIPKPIETTTTTTSIFRASERRSLSEPFKPRSLDSGLASYEPVYSNVNFGINTYKSISSSNFIKKPLPIPRIAESTPQTENAGTRPKFDGDTAKNDSFDNMTDSKENFSEILANTETKFSDGTALKENKEKIRIEPEHNIEEIVVLQEKNIPSDQVILVESKAETNILKNKFLVKSNESAGSEKGSEKSSLQNETTGTLDSQSMADPIANDNQSEASSSYIAKSTVSIAVTTKGEQLDIRRAKTSAEYVLEEDVEDVQRKSSTVEASNVNLFTMDSHSSYDSYLELFKSKESKDFDNLRGKKSSGKNHFDVAGFAYVEELTAEIITSDDVQDEAKPKIVDFVPLDDDTTPFFTKDDKKSYDTLEREKTFHVLSQASKMNEKFSRESANFPTKEKHNFDVATAENNKKDGENNKPESSLEILAQKSSSFSKVSSQADTSRTSFTQAKKIFEALVEANKDERPKTAGSTRSPARYSVRDSHSMDQMKSHFSKEDEVARLGETGLMIKDGDQKPFDVEEKNKLK